ncbi:Apoptosis-stimulating of p53 protein 1 [Liparis tanakae]|uniref:Apoptosis-stimulating of p53 protein 1 n=1 Tax=Liparis tanakae TaxID=230148 RepID=A0A4Z2HWG4_9TELE|nr:Apoptosis-stimulating of p53 protein 1 [Liparis tanakae]
MEWNEVDLVQEFTVEGQCSKIKVRSCRITWDSMQVPRVELTLSELQEMATRQQQQIEAQQQMLVAKEQRLRYLHQGGRSNQGQTQSEAEKLQRLKERVETQEAKLKKIRAMRGQVDYSKLINGNLSAEINHVSSLFQEKQAELQSAVVRVDQLPSGYGTYPSATHQVAGHHCTTSSLPRSAPGTLGWPRSNAANASSYSSTSALQQIQQRISISPSSPQGSASHSSPLSPQTERTDPPPAVAVRPYVPDHPSRPQSPRKGPATMNSSSIYSMYLQQPQAKNYGSLSNRTTVGGGGRAGGEDVTDKEGRKGGGESSDGQILPPPTVDNIPRPLSPTKLTPVAHSQLRYQSDADLEVLRRRLSNAPRPLKKRSSITEPEGPQGPNIQKLLYQRFNTLAGGMEGGSGNTFYQPDCLLGEMDNIHSANGNVEAGDKHGGVGTAAGEVQNLNASSRRLSPPSVAVETPKDTTAKADTAVAASPPAQTRPASAPERPEDQNNNNKRGSSPAQNSVGHASPSPSPPAPPSLPTAKRTNLKKPSSERTGHGLRVKFNPLALLLDASLEGEFDLVQRIIYEHYLTHRDCRLELIQGNVRMLQLSLTSSGPEAVENPSMPNDEGITPLHNAVCAGHHHIVKFLLDFGVNVNAADSDGWTPLHCAASCNSVHLCKMLVESGAAIFATTISDVETAADKCEEMEEGYAQCSQFLYGVQEKLGVMNKGLVYTLWDYTAQQADELSFSEGDALTVLRRRDDTETEWWWARLNDHEGYIPRNLLGCKYLNDGFTFGFEVSIYADDQNSPRESPDPPESAPSVGDAVVFRSALMMFRHLENDVNMMQ